MSSTYNMMGRPLFVAVKEGAPVDNGCQALRTASEESAIVAVLPVTDTAGRVVPDNIDASNDSFKDKGSDGKPTPATISVHLQRQEVGGLPDNIYHE